MNNIILLTNKLKNRYFLYEKILDDFILMNNSYFSIKKIFVDEEDKSEIFNEFPVFYFNSYIIESKNIIKFIFELIFNNKDSNDYDEIFNYIHTNYNLIPKNDFINNIEINNEIYLKNINENHKIFFNLIFLICNEQLNKIEYKKILKINYNLNIINEKLKKFSLTTKITKANENNNLIENNNNNIKNMFFSLSIFLGMTGIMYYISTINS
jgi:hypothetical protein